MDFWRQLDIVSPKDLERINVTMIGVGGIGSPAVLALSKMGVSNITVYDDDSVELHNLPNQFFRVEDLKRSKVEALADIVASYSEDKIAIKNERYTDQKLAGIVISGVDSMSARRDIWNGVAYNTKIPFYIEARMGAEVARIYTVRPCIPSEVRWYEKTLYSDEEAVDAPCSARAIIYCTFMTASLIANQVKKIAKNQGYENEIIFDLVTMSLMTKSASS